MLAGVRVLDGAMATELEARGACIDGPLWSARVLEEAPEKIVAVHRAYIEAGADCIETASYQVSRMGYAACGMEPARADVALLRSVELARRAAAEFPGRRIVIAASLGPYGAALHNGAEYTGDYDCSFAELVRFHRERIAVLAAAHDAQRPDVLAFETLPSLEEARALGEALKSWPGLRVWFSFTCRDGRHVAHGEPLADCATVAAKLPQTVAVGVNCTRPELMGELVGELHKASARPVIVYPNSGEEWDRARRLWTGTRDVTAYGRMAEGWFKAGAQMVGGCCRTGPAHIAEVKQAAAAVPEVAMP